MRQAMARMSGGGGGNRWRIALWGGALALWLLPLALTQVTDEMNWGLEDFAIFGAMLIAACAGYELAARITPNRLYRALAAAGIAAAFLLTWAQLAVGVFD